MATQKVKVLDEKYGVQITRPWSKEMYDHNDNVAEQMRINIKQALINCYANDNDSQLMKIATYLTYNYGQGYTIDDVFDSVCNELETIENYRLNEEYPNLVNLGVVLELKKYMIGYDK